MASNITNLNLPVPAASDPPDGPGAFFALAQRLGTLGTPWTPTIDGIGDSVEVGGAYAVIGGFCFGYGFVRIADGQYPSTGSNLLNLPLPAIYLAGIPYSIGEADYTRRSDFLRVHGRVMQSSAFGSDRTKAYLHADSTPAGGGYVQSGGLATGVPFSIGSTDAMYINIRVRYFVGN